MTKKIIKYYDSSTSYSTSDNYSTSDTYSSSESANNNYAEVKSRRGKVIICKWVTIITLSLSLFFGASVPTTILFIFGGNTCEEPTFENYAASGTKVKEGKFLRLACQPGYFVHTKDMERKCTNMSLEPDFETSPAECLTGCPVPYYAYMV